VDDEPQERQLNIHLDPEQMAGVYANFANVTFSPYEFTLTFARIDHEIEEGDVPGVVVSRVNMSQQFFQELLAAMPPFLGGGSMIETVEMTGSTFAPPPTRFEAGTPPIAEVIGLGAAVDYLSNIGMEAIAWHEKELTAYALEALQTVPGLRIFGPPVPVGRGGTISFALEGVHPHDVGQVLDAEGVEVRVGHHCARPTCARFGVPAMTRASFYLYTTIEEIDALVRGLERVRGVFA